MTDGLGGRAPRALTAGVVLLVLSALPWLAIYGDNAIAAFAADDVRLVGRQTGNATGLLVLNILFIALVLRMRGGRERIRTVVTFTTVLFDLLLLTSVIGASRFFGEDGVTLVLVTSIITIVLSAAGLVLSYRRDSSTYIRDATAARKLANVTGPPRPAKARAQ